MIEDKIYHILVVEDQKNWQRVFKDLLESDLGFKVSFADNSEDAKKMLEDQKGKFDLAVLDVRLKDEQVYNVDGLVVLKRIKSDFPKIKTIVITGYPQNIPDNIRDIVTLKLPEDLNFDEVLKRRIRELLKINTWKMNQ